MHSFSGKWTGAYTYGPHFDTDLREKPVPFTLEFIETDGVIDGFCVDSNLVETFDEPLVLSGSIEEIFISFTKQFPHYIRIEKSGSIFQDPTKEGLPVHFLGTYDETHQVFFGMWEVTRAENSWENSDEFTLIAGQWFMKKQP